MLRSPGLGRNPLRRASDRAEAWIRVGLLAAFLIAGPMAALAAGGWAYHAGISAARVQPAQPSYVNTPRPGSLAEAYAGSQAWPRSRPQDAVASARTDEVLAGIAALALTALVLLAVLRLTTAFLARCRLASWEAAWSRVGPQWSRGRPS